MPRYGGSGLRAATYLMVMAGYLALFTVPDIGIAALIPPLLIIAYSPLGEWIDSRFAWYRRLTTVASVLCLAMLPLWVGAFGLLNAVTFLIVYIQAYELTHQKKPQNYYHVYLMSFFLLVSACVRNPEAAIALVLGLFLLSAVWAFFLLEVAKATGTAKALAPPDVMALNVRYPQGAPVTRRFDWGVTVSTLAMAVASILLTVALFMATPRMEAGILGRDNMGAIARTGLDSTVSLAGGGQIIEDQRIVMRVTFPDLPNGQFPGEMYWRSTSMDLYTGNTWERRGIHSHWRTDDAPKFVPITRHDRNVSRDRMRDNSAVVRQDVYMDSSPSEGVPALDLALEITARNAHIDWALGFDGSAVVLRNRQNVFQYEALSEIYTPPPSELRQAPGNYDEVIPIENYLYLIQQDLLPETFNLVRQITDPHDTIYDKAMAIQAYLRSDGGFLYSLNVPLLPEKNPIDFFVLQAKTGHCQLFASAMALMLRSLGVPTRVVAGYRGGEWDENDGAYSVRGDMAHLWVEVYFLDHGWVRFDPSPASDYDSLGVMGRFQRFMSRTSLRMKMLWYQQVVGYESGFRLDRLRDLQVRAFTNPFRRAADAGVFPDNDVAREPAPLLRETIVPLILLTILVLLGWWFWSRRDAKPITALTADQARAIQLHAALRRELRRHGVRTANQTAGELLAIARTIPEIDAAVVEAVLDEYAKARFGGNPLPPPRFAQWRERARRIGLAKA